MIGSGIMAPIRLGASALSLCGVLVPVSAVAQSAASPYTWASRYDLEGRVTATMAPDPDGAGALKYAAVRNTYNAQGWLTKVESGELSSWQPETVTAATWTGFTIFKTSDIAYDLDGRKIKETLSTGGVAQSVVQWSYDGLDRPVCNVVRMNAATFGSVPTDACALGTAGSYGNDRVTKTLYNSNGRVDRIQKAFGTALQQDYVSYTYTPNGNPATVTDANGTTAQYSYDGLDRMSRWYFASKTTAGIASTTDYEEYGYDANSNRTTVRKRDGRVLTFSYDPLNRVTSKIVPTGCAPIQVGGCPPASATRSVYYGYDNRGLQLFARFDSGSGEGIATTYDNMGRATASTSTMGGVARTIGSTWDADSNRTRVTHPDGQYVNYYREGLDRIYYSDLNSAVPLFYPPYDSAGRVAVLYRWSGGTWGIPTGYSYDGVDRLTVQGLDLSGTSADLSTSFGYNPESQIVSRTRNNDAYVYGGDVSLTRQYAVNGLNQYLTAGPASFTYDANGNLTSDGSVTFVYDAENRLVSASGAKTASLTYDPLGRLSVSTDGASLYTRYLYDGNKLIAEYDVNGNMLRRYVHSGGDDDPLVWYEGSGTTSARYLYADQLGSITAIADSTGAPIAINTYDDWGIPGASNTGRFQYTGQAWLPELGMYYYKARIYSPTLGRFLQTDPIGYKDQVNLYAYVANDPVNGTDPTGTAGEYSCAKLGIGCGPQNGHAGQGMIEDAVAHPISTGIEIGVAVLAPEAIAMRGLGLAGRVAADSFPRAMNIMGKLAGGLERTGGSSGQRTWQGMFNGGEAAARRLFNGLTRGESAARDGGRLGRLGDGSAVQMSTRALKDGTIRTDVRISRSITETGSRIPRTENLKLRFDEKP